ncbi:MAG TPA: hypothetical protein VGL56_02460 [Fimbriimonadaceae bacterium]|jgi:hypothetical protein
MNIFLISLVIAVVAIVARDGVSEKFGPIKLNGPKNALISAVVLALLAGASFGLWKSSPGALGGGAAALIGLFAGAAAASIAQWFGASEWQRSAGRTAPLALAAFAVSAIVSLPSDTLISAVFGAAAAAWIFSLSRVDDLTEWPVRTAIYTGCIVAIDLLGTYHNPGIVSLGEQLAGVVVIAGILAIGIETQIRSRDAKLAFMGPILALAFSSFGAFLLFRKIGAPDSSAFIFVAAAFIALISSWMIRQEAATLLVRMLLAVILWIALATAAYGYARGLGMSIALMAGAGNLIILANRRALLCIGPLAALVVYRVFRQMHADTAEAFDIGQHYAEIGFVLGIVLPVMAQEWTRNLKAKSPWVAGGLWVVLLAAAPLPVAVALSDKGIVGYLVGLGIAPVLEGLKGEQSSQSLSLALGLSSGMALLYTWMEPHLDVDRHGKIVALSYIAVGMAIAIIGIVLTSRSKSVATEAVA